MVQRFSLRRQLSKVGSWPRCRQELCSAAVGESVRRRQLLFCSARRHKGALLAAAVGTVWRATCAGFVPLAMRCSGRAVWGSPQHPSSARSQG